MTQLAPPSQPSVPQENQPAATPETRSLNSITSGTTTALKTIVLDVEGMMCAGCVSAVEKQLAQCEGVSAATVNLITEVAAVTYRPEADPQAIAQALTEAGYPSQLRQAQGNTALAAETDWLARKERDQQEQTSQLVVAIALLLISTLGHLQHIHWPASWPVGWPTNWSIPILSTLWFHGTLATLTLIFPARKILREGMQGARQGAPNMNTLVSLGALSAYFTSLVALMFPSLGWSCFFDEPIMLLSFILLGRTLENRARFRASSSLRSLIALQPTLARLVPPPDQTNPGTAETTGVQIPVNQVQVGEWLQVLPGEKIPVDGVVTAGQTTVDESMLTGESIPVMKQTDAAVVAGSLNQSGAITLQVTRTGTETTLAQMIQLVETAQVRKAPIQGLADVISGYFTYGVLICAALTFSFWYAVGLPMWPEVTQIAIGHAHHIATQAEPIVMASSTHALRLLVSLKLAIAVIVVACPCALGLATPTAVLVGSGIGAEQGLLIRGGDILEATHELDTLVFDKTGTLTTGKPNVTDCVSLAKEISDDELLQIAATVESGTRHPLGVAIGQAAQTKSLTLLSAHDFQTQAGFGIAANVILDQAAGKDGLICLGNLAWMEKNGCAVDGRSRDRADSLGQAGKTVVFVAQDRQLIGLIGVADTLRSEAIDTVTRLQQMGLGVHLLSGDTAAAASAIAQRLGLAPEQIQANMTPQGKVEALTQLKQDGHRIGFVGDGINDAPALATADVGIALNSGTEVAMETADIVLMNDTLAEVLSAIQLSRATFNKIRQNLAWAFAYNLICIPLAAGAFLPAFGLSLNPGFAGGLMVLSSLTVVVNSLQLRYQSF